MQLLTTKSELKSYLASRPRPVLVPTMGNLHAGHLSLVEQARRLVDGSGAPVLVSIFVNPTQFGAGEDFDSYPRTLEADMALLEGVADGVFAPSVGEMYPDCHRTRVLVPALASILCGASRPGHFDGVCLVVSKLFHLVNPQTAIFGQKDRQQLAIIRQMVKDLDFDIDIYDAPIARASDGLALSSRNAYLTVSERERAPLLYQALQTIAATLGTTDAQLKQCIAHTKTHLQRHGLRVDYLEVRQEDLSPYTGGPSGCVLGAVYLGKTRLIDNVFIDRETPDAHTS